MSEKPWVLNLDGAEITIRQLGKKVTLSIEQGRLLLTPEVTEGTEVADGPIWLRRPDEITAVVVALEGVKASEVVLEQGEDVHRA